MALAGIDVHVLLPATPLGHLPKNVLGQPLSTPAACLPPHPPAANGPLFQVDLTMTTSGRAHLGHGTAVSRNPPGILCQ